MNLDVNHNITQDLLGRNQYLDDLIDTFQENQVDLLNGGAAENSNLNYSIHLGHH
jgi:hypothetical protein